MYFVTIKRRRLRALLDDARASVRRSALTDDQRRVHLLRARAATAGACVRDWPGRGALAHRADGAARRASTSRRRVDELVRLALGA